MPDLSHFPLRFQLRAGDIATLSLSPSTRFDRTRLRLTNRLTIEKRRGLSVTTINGRDSRRAWLVGSRFGCPCVPYFVRCLPPPRGMAIALSTADSCAHARAPHSARGIDCGARACGRSIGTVSFGFDGRDSSRLLEG